MSDVFISTNGDQRAIPGALDYLKDPDQDSQLLTNAAADTNTTATVIAGKRYLLTCKAVGNFYAGLADATTAANVQWVAQLSQPGVVVTIPLGYTALHYATSVNNGLAYLIPLK